MILRRFIKSICLYQLRYNSSSAYSDKLYQPIISEGYKGISNIIIPKNFKCSNQIINTENDTQLKEIMGQFESPIKFAFGYGSGVFEQDGYAKDKTMPQIDLIYLVENAEQFHQKNLRQFPEHYSNIKIFNYKAITRLQEVGVGAYFNPYVLIDKQLIKYGIASADKTLLDLSEWSSLYLAGRLQKPVKYLIDNEREDHAIIKFLNQFNLKNAMTLAILLIKNNEFNEKELYETITKISYLGDFRLIIGGENPNKVKNIVSKQYDNFKKLYEPILNYFINKNLIIITKNDKEIREFKKNLSIESKTYLISKLPIKFRKNLYQLYKDKSIREIAKDPNLDLSLIKVVKKIVRLPSFLQMLKGILSAGLIKSIKYAIEKKIKSWKG